MQINISKLLLVFSLYLCLFAFDGFCFWCVCCNSLCVSVIYKCVTTPMYKSINFLYNKTKASASYLTSLSLNVSCRTLQYVLYNTSSTIHLLQYALYNTSSTIRTLQYVLYITSSTIRTLHYIFYTTYSTIRTLQYVYSNEEILWYIVPQRT